MNATASEATPVIRFIETPAQRQRLDLIHHLLGFGRQMIVLSGEAGSGRSRFLQQIKHEAAENWQLVLINAETMVSTEQLLHSLTNAVLPDSQMAADSGQVFERLKQQLREINQSGQQLVVLLDNGDKLDPSALSHLLELVHASDELNELRAVVAVNAASDFVERAQHTSREAALVHVIDLPRLDPAAMDEMLDAIVHARGLDSSGLDAATRSTLIGEARGNPAQLISRLEAGLAAPSIPQRAFPRLKMLGGMAVVVLFGVLLVVVALSEKRDQAPATEALEPIEIILPGKHSSVAAETSASANNKHTPSAAVNEVTVKPPPAEQTVLELEIPPSPTPELQQEQSQTNDTAEPMSLPLSSPAAAAGASAVEIAQEPLEARPEIAPVLPPETAESAESTSVETSTVKASTEVEDVSVSEAPETNSYSGKWVLTQPETYYVIQLFGSRERTAARRFIRQHGLTDKATVFALSLEGAPWYVVVSGVYPHREAAGIAIEALPQSLRPTGAWPRTIASLKP